MSTTVPNNQPDPARTFNLESPPFSAMAEWNLLNHFYHRMYNVIQWNTSLSHTIRSMRTNLNMDQQRLAEYHQYAANLELVHQDFESQISAADNKIAELEASLLEEQASITRLQNLTDKLQAREIELLNEVQALQRQNREFSYKLEEAETRVLEHTTLWYKQFERAERLQKNLDLATPPGNSKLPIRDFDRSRSVQPSSAKQRSLSIRRGAKDLSVFTNTG